DDREQPDDLDVQPRRRPSPPAGLDHLPDLADDHPASTTVSGASPRRSAPRWGSSGIGRISLQWSNHTDRARNPKPYFVVAAVSTAPVSEARAQRNRTVPP